MYTVVQFPVGRTRLETVSVIICAVIMSIATVLVIRESVQALIDGLAHRKPCARPELSFLQALPLRLLCHLHKLHAHTDHSGGSSPEKLLEQYHACMSACTACDGDAQVQYSCCLHTDL